MEVDVFNDTHVSCLHLEILSNIFQYLDVSDKGRAGQVCHRWRAASYYHCVWRTVEAKLHLPLTDPTVMHSIEKRGVRRFQILSLENNLFQNVLHMNNLESLNLVGCYNLTDDWIKDVMPVNGMLKLKVLNLGMCNITDEGLLLIVQCTVHLQVLDLGGCSSINDSALKHISEHLPKLKSLNLRCCRKVTNVGLGYIAGTHSGNGTLELEHLSLQACECLSFDGFSYLSKLVKLQSIDLSFCLGVTNSCLMSLSKLPNLKELRLRGCKDITHRGLDFLAQKNLPITLLDIGFCKKVGDNGLRYVSQGLYNLRSLSLNACQISDKGLRWIAKSLTDLRTLDISQCSKITDYGLILVAKNLSKLSNIDVYGCSRITTVGIDRLMKLPQLKVNSSILKKI